MHCLALQQRASSSPLLLLLLLLLFCCCHQHTTAHTATMYEQTTNKKGEDKRARMEWETKDAGQLRAQRHKLLLIAALSLLFFCLLRLRLRPVCGWISVVLAFPLSPYLFPRRHHQLLLSVFSFVLLSSPPPLVSSAWASAPATRRAMMPCNTNSRRRRRAQQASLQCNRRRRMRPTRLVPSTEMGQCTLLQHRS